MGLRLCTPGLGIPSMGVRPVAAAQPESNPRSPPQSLGQGSSLEARQSLTVLHTLTGFYVNTGCSGTGMQHTGSSFLGEHKSAQVLLLLMKG